MPLYDKVSDEKRAAIFADWKSGHYAYKQLVEKYKQHQSTIGKIVREMRGAKPNGAPALPAAIPADQVAKRNGKYTHLVPRIRKLRQEGRSVKEVAAKLNMSRAATSYYFTKLKQAVIPTEQGESSNGHLDARFLVGFGCAELDRTLGAIAQRLGISTNLLRSGFSKFLGSSSVRQ